jgi:hypothetical protein
MNSYKLVVQLLQTIPLVLLSAPKEFGIGSPHSFDLVQMELYHIIGLAFISATVLLFGDVGQVVVDAIKPLLEHLVHGSEYRS